jgi:hypothetical protein
MREDRGLAVSLAALRCQLTAMPCRLYEVRLIHSVSHKPYPGVRQWTGRQLSDPATVGFLRIRNREGYDVYFRPYAGSNLNAGYILLDLDDPVPGILARLRAKAVTQPRRKTIPQVPPRMGHAPRARRTAPKALPKGANVRGPVPAPATAPRAARPARSRLKRGLPRRARRRGRRARAPVSCN